MGRQKSEEQTFFELLAALAATTPHFVLSDPVIATYERMLAPFGLREVNRALEKIILEKSSRDPFPSIADIREKINPSLSPETEAPVIVGRIIQAISRIGPYRTSEAKAFIGEVGWKVCEMSGGFETVCEQTNEKNIGTFRSQWIRLCESLLKSQSQQVALPEPKTNNTTDRLLGLGEVLKLIEDKNK